MSKQLRPTISLSARTHAKLKAFCDVNNVSMAAVIEREVNKYLDAQPENLLDEPIRVAEETPGSMIPSLAGHPLSRAPLFGSQREFSRVAYRIARRRGEQP